MTARARSPPRERADENAAINRTLAYTPDVRIAGHAAPGDGADLRRRPRPVHAARAEGAARACTPPATFFEVGVGQQYFHAATAAIVSSGYPIGDHT